jgi:polyisoprenyl-teichoic acid--peptidoglycan teichoic acid transferase
LAHRNRGQLEPTAGALSRDNGPSHYVAKRATKKKHFILRTVLICVVAVIAVAGIAFAKYYNDINSKIKANITPELEAQLSSSKQISEPFYMLLLGVDKSQERADEWGDDSSNFRSDTIILVRVDPKNMKVTLVSIARDTMVDMGDYGMQKINAAYALGGPSYTVQVVEKYAGVDISHYAEVDFEALTAIVDGIGGIEVTVPTDVVDPLANANIQAGTQTLNGEQALALCRSRHAYDEYSAGDFYRAANQRAVITAIIKKVLSSDPLTIANTISNLADGVSTDLDASQIISLALQMKDLDVDNNVYSGLNPTEGQMIDGISYQVTLEPDWTEMMQRVDSGESPYENASDDPTAGVSASAGDGTTTTTTSTGSAMDDVDAVHKGDIEVLNGSGANGAAAAAANLLEKAGYTATTGVADSSDYQEITIVYRGDDSMAIAKGVGETLSSLGTINYVNDSSHAYSYTGDVLVILGSD